MSSKGNKVRRGQLIAPFGVGAIIVLKDGTSVIGAGLDQWFRREVQPERQMKAVDVSEFEVLEARLRRALRVGHLYFPPDWRRTWGTDTSPNIGLTVPVLRFPRWHLCGFCHRLQRFPLSTRGRQDCRYCTKYKSRLVQVRFMVMCKNGHVDDFPWREWVHHTAHPTCEKPLLLVNTGGSSLADLLVKCECEVSPRSLSGIMEPYRRDEDGEDGQKTFLSQQLDASETEFLCRGRRPWLGDEDGEGCLNQLFGSLLNATNAYFSQTTSSIFLPAQEEPPAPAALIDMFLAPPLATALSLLQDSETVPTTAFFRKRYGIMLRDFPDEQIETAIAVVLRSEAAVAPEEAGEDEVPLKPDEYRVLQSECFRDELQIRSCPPISYTLALPEGPLAHYFDCVSLVERLRETRVLKGFTRLKSSTTGTKLHELKALLWREMPPPVESWLPAYVVFGEGIFLKFHADALDRWEQRMYDGQSLVAKRVGPLLGVVRTPPGADGNDVPRWLGRFVMIHTFAHLLINRLVFECGYSSASLRERLYVSIDPDAPMAGVLIYTAAGDAEGTMGGLVRMGRPGRLEHVIRRALEAARWCSSDPVCMELGDQGGQGPESCNLAACHDCALVPETSCEHFNRYLDRGLVVGDQTRPALGFFARTE